MQIRPLVLNRCIKKSGNKLLVILQPIQEIDSVSFRSRGSTAPIFKAKLVSIKMEALSFSKPQEEMFCLQKTVSVRSYRTAGREVLSH